MRRLYTRIYLHLLGAVVVAGLVASVVFANGWRAAFPRSMAERFVGHGAGLLADVVENPSALGRMTQRMAREFDTRITVRDPDGRLLAAGGAELPPLMGSQLDKVRKGPTTSDGQDWFAAAPIHEEHSGRLVAIVETAPLARFRPPSPLRPLLTLVLVLVVVTFASAPLARRISRPVEQLTEATRRFGEGELGYRVAVGEGRDERDEIGALRQAWNEMADRVEQLVRGQKELLANVSHDLRSPLTRIRVALALLPTTPESEARLHAMEQDLAELDRLIDDVLTASRLESVAPPLRREELDMAELLEVLAERAASAPGVGGIRVEAEPGLWLHADRTLLRRALWNLVENAGRYGAPPITLAARRDGDRVLLTVSDEGPGIAAADRARVLDAFQRLDRARTPSADGSAPSGFGLGLTIARRVAEAHGGSIHLDEARPDGRGLRVTLSLPA